MDRIQKGQFKLDLRFWSIYFIIVNPEGLRIYLLVSYELVTEPGIQANANLRVNVED